MTREGYVPFDDPIYDDPQNWKPGTLGIHELLDRVRLVTNLWHETVTDHASARHDADITRRAEEIGDLMEDLYQYVGEVSLLNDPVLPPHDHRYTWGPPANLDGNRSEQP